MPSQKRSAVNVEQQVAALTKRANKVRNKTDITILSAALNVHPELGKSALDHVLTLTGETRESVLKKDKELREKRKNGSEKKELALMNVSFEESGEDDGDLPPQVTVHGGQVEGKWLDGAKTLGTCNSNVLSEILTMAEPASMSKHALKALILPGKRAIAKDRLLELIEYGLGFDSRLKFMGVMRDRRTFQAEVQRKNEERGRRLMQLALPANWQASGVFAVNFNGDKASLLNKFSGKSVVAELPWKATLEQNYSETKAALVEVGGVGRIMCTSLVDAKPVGDLARMPGSVQRRQHALADGSLPPAAEPLALSPGSMVTPPAKKTMQSPLALPAPPPVSSSSASSAGESTISGSGSLGMVTALKAAATDIVVSEVGKAPSVADLTEVAMEEVFGMLAAPEAPRTATGDQEDEARDDGEAAMVADA